jgi:hypothetical protein
VCAGDRVVLDSAVARVEHDDAANAFVNRQVVIDADHRRVAGDHTEGGVGRQRDSLDSVSAPAEHGDADIEAAHGPARDRHTGVACVVGDAEVANPFVEARAGRDAVTADRVAVQVERDVVRTDHDPVARAVGEIAVELRIGIDDRAAA